MRKQPEKGQKLSAQGMEDQGFLQLIFRVESSHTCSASLGAQTSALAGGHSPIAVAEDGKEEDLFRQGSICLCDFTSLVHVSVLASLRMMSLD